MDRLEITKVIVGPGIALFVAVIGWILTDRYNATQLEVATQRGAADVEIARINAALRYMEFLRNVPDESIAQKRQAVAIAAPAPVRRAAERERAAGEQLTPVSA